ncbi:DUF421 domain-containing protein [Parerythrobacter lacustris]|uniref:DUF421 domain-containing protein n=1 Tax=Parerythrobacter lacustris TaxID=2969984 RepID=A0ABT1XLY2_9SPHN|nr:YetF domain-containing protein [Parerythrobacter lacustris]MCR2832678.1 DUF421 domain-containing protein [Parerythrobacter lacustris]
MFIDQPIADAILRGAVLAIVALMWVILLVRVIGLRSFSKMTSFDFVMTVAMGSLVATASQSSDWPAYLQALAAMAGLFAIQFTVARLRRASSGFRDAIQNEPLLLMRDGVVIDEALKRSRVSREDLWAKLREANVLDLGQVRAAILETTGDMSILHGDHLEDRLLDGVRRTGLSS